MKRYGLMIVLAVCSGWLGCRSQRASAGSNSLEDSVFKDVQRATFNYFWDGAEPNSGLARERVHLDNRYPENDAHIVTTGGGGFGVMAILVGVNRGFITRQQALERMQRIVGFLETADRFHGAWPHWINGETGRVKPFGKKDNGGDLVETSFLLQGLLCVRQYFKDGNPAEQQLAARIDKLWREVDFNWYRNGKDVLYWHWSAEYQWEMNFPVTGYNECLIMYVLAAASPTHSVPASVYHQGWAQSGKINDTTTKYGHTLVLGHNGAKEWSGPLFWAHYSYMGLNPQKLQDRYAGYWKHNVNHTLINHDWCVENPKGFKGYGPGSWGLTSSYSVKGYSGHAPGPQRDIGVIAPTAALSSMPYTPAYSKQAMMHWYTTLKDKIWGKYGFYDAFSETHNWYPPHYLAIDQGPIVVMMENYRTGLLWELFMSCNEVQQGLKKLGFTSW